MVLSGTVIECVRVTRKFYTKSTLENVEVFTSQLCNTDWLAPGSFQDVRGGVTVDGSRNISSSEMAARTRMDRDHTEFRGQIPGHPVLCVVDLHFSDSVTECLHI